MSKKTYTVLFAVEHDNKRYEKGALLLWSDAQAESLIKANVIVLDPDGPTEVDSPVVPTDAAERQAAIVAAIGKMDPANADLWLRDGRPDITAIAEITGWTVTAAERNAAWAEIASK
jgi:hypothetical protein